MNKPCLRTFFVLISATFASQSLADQVLLDDGSLLKGSIKEVANGQLIINTAFADDVTIDYGRVIQISTDNKYVIELNTNDRIVGQLAINDKGEHILTNTAFGTVNVNPSNIKSVWATDAKAPVTIAEEQYQQQIEEIQVSNEQEKAELKESYEQAIAAIRQERDKLLDPWSGSLALGAMGSSGNTKRFGAHGRGELNRETDDERMGLYLEVNFQKEDGEQTVNEKLAGAYLERDINEMWFARGTADFEIDDFEELDLRAITTASIGRFFIREDDLKFKGFVGLGYRYEGYTDGTTRKDPTGVLGYDVKYKLNSHLKLFHDFHYYPSFSSPGKNYLVVTNFGGEMPLAAENWKLRASVRAQHNGSPSEDAKRTDTSYQMNLVYDWE